MKETKSQSGNWRLIVLPLMLLAFVAMLGTGAAFAQLPVGRDASSLQMQGNKPAQGTPTPTPTCSPLGAWSIVPSPNPGTGGYLNGVAAVSSNDVWAVGWYGEGGTFHSLTMHWNGSIWSIVPNPGNGLLYSAAAVSSNDVWAVGGYSNGGGTLTMHWNGTAWSIVPSPTGSGLFGVTAISSNDVWAVGYANGHTLTLHWDGSSWSIVPSPNQGTSVNTLQ